jgi:hypothetical protein
MTANGDGQAPPPHPKMIVDQLVDGVTAASLVTVVAYAIVFAFEEGFNAFFQLPADYVATNVLSVFHVLSLMAYVAFHDLRFGLFELGAALALFFFIPAYVYARHPYVLGALALLLYCLSTVFTPLVLLSAALVFCFVLRMRTEDKGVQQARLLSRVGPHATKAIFLFLFLLTPLFYCGFRFAETQNPRLVLTEILDDKPKPPTSNTWVIARVLGDEFIAVRLLDPNDRVKDCRDQYVVTKLTGRPDRLARDLRVFKQSEAKPLLTWKEFTTPLNYCLYGSEESRFQGVTAALFVRQGPVPIIDPKPTPRP